MEELKLRKDYSTEVDSLLSKIDNTNLTDETHVNSAVSDLLDLEKKTRFDNDVESTKRLCSKIISIFIDKQNWPKVGEYSEILCKKHAQHKNAVASVIQTAFGCFDKIHEDAQKMELLKKLRDLSKGKMHTDLEFARMTLDMAHMKEIAGELVEASEIIQDVYVETLASMAFEERFGFLLEQFRLSLLVGANIRAELTAEKFNVAFLDKHNPANGLALKKKYYRLLVEHCLVNKDFMGASEALLSLHNLEEDPMSEKAIESLKRAALFAIISEDGEKSENFISSLLKKYRKALTHPSVKAMRELLTMRNGDRLIKWPFTLENVSQLSVGEMLPVEADTERMGKIWALKANEDYLGNYEKSGAGYFGPINNNDGLGQDFYGVLKESVCRHNIRVFSKHYNNANLSKIAELTSLSEREAEILICAMVQENKLTALINRPQKTVNFVLPMKRSDVLDQWGDAVASTLAKVQRVCQLIEKDTMLYG